MFSFTKQRALVLLLSTSAAFSHESENKLCASPELYDDHPILCHMLDRLWSDGDALAEEMTRWAETHGLLAGANIDLTEEQQQQEPLSSSSQLPVVFAHGMGDSCFNSGFGRLVKYTSDKLGGVYSLCIPTGKDQKEDTTNGYFLNMDASVDVFAQAIQNDPKLKNGFHAVGLSQGNNVIRGYIARYNDPPVNTFISINGVNAGEGAVPHCAPSSKSNKVESSSFTSICDLLLEQASKRAYTEFAQEHSFQANYWRDPRPGEKKNYETFSQLARWNNEGFFNATLKDNFAKTKKFVWIMATQDGMVWPKEGEHWGAPDPQAPFQKVLPRTETEWYVTDSFGLKSAEEAGKNHYLSFDGDHLQFTMDEYTDWITTYLQAKDVVTTRVQ